MNELIKVNYEDDIPTIDGRELHEGLGTKDPYTQWFSRMCAYDFEENRDFVLVSQICETNNPKNPTTTRISHRLTLDMAKEICMLQRSEKGKQFRQYFIECEKALNSPEQIMARALKLADRNIKALQENNDILKLQIEADKPKVIFADAVATSKTDILIGELAKILKGNGVEIGQNRMFEYLRENGYLIKRQGTDWNAPTQKSMNLKLFKVKETAITHSDGHVTINKTTKVTGKGQQYFINLFISDQAQRSLTNSGG